MVLPSWGVWCSLTKLAKRRGFEPIIQQIPAPVRNKLIRSFRLMLLAGFFYVLCIVLMEAFDLAEV